MSNAAQHSYNFATSKSAAAEGIKTSEDII